MYWGCNVWCFVRLGRGFRHVGVLLAGSIVLEDRSYAVQPYLFLLIRVSIAYFRPSDSVNCCQARSGGTKSTFHPRVYIKGGTTSFLYWGCDVWCFLRFEGGISARRHVVDGRYCVLDDGFYAVDGRGDGDLVISVPSNPGLRRILVNLRYRKLLSGKKVEGPSLLSIQGHT